MLSINDLSRIAYLLVLNGYGDMITGRSRLEVSGAEALLSLARFSACIDVFPVAIQNTTTATDKQIYVRGFIWGLAKSTWQIREIIYMQIKR